MPYAQGRVIHDADAHIMEWPTWLVDYAEPDVRDELEPRTLEDGSGRPLDLDRVRATHASDDYRAVEAEEIMSRKNFAAKRRLAGGRRRLGSVYDGATGQAGARSGGGNVRERFRGCRSACRRSRRPTSAESL